MKIATIIGNRPQIVKLSALHKELKNDIIIYTGQHYDRNMCDVFFEEFGLCPDYSLGIKETLPGKQIAKMIIRLEEVLIKEKPDLVLVYGDTNSTLSGAMAAYNRQIPIGHIEAGLRCYDKTMPEENNRVIVDHLSTYLFCPTVSSVENLSKEGIVKNVYLTGDVMADLVKGEREEGDYVLATIHRQTNVDNKQRLEEIISMLRVYPRVVLPIHPRTKKRINEFGIKTGEIEIVPPVSFHEMLDLERKAQLIITDSGGVQREAYLLGVPCVVLRERTEWEELKSHKKGLLGENASKKIAEIING
jgi:UDP-N-acetylglucosamine 2-epimerase